MPYEGSQNYIWSTRLLGKGTSGNVYLGYHKKTANKCAVKVFKANAGHHAERELELMRTLDHRNIVKVLAVESSARSSERVLILEYCNHGNLFNLLRKPVYIFGLPEKEVVNFLVQMGDVMKYLHSKDIVHRDWKPGNIMCCRERGAGRLMFKVGDFGTARTLEANSEDFSTLHGTVEYLHPIMLKDMIERKDIKKTGGSYSSKSDLWSFGATLYQVATGQLPFAVARGRRDTQGMSEMTLDKPDDAIAGSRTEDGATHWKQHLPDTCRLSQYLRVFLEKMLLSLMQNNLTKVPTFPQFFETVDDFSKRIVIYMFSVITCTHHQLYLKPSQKLSHVKEAIAQLTDVRAADQILILDCHFLEETVEESWEIVSYPATSADNPVILLAPEIRIDMLWITVKISPPTLPVFKPSAEKDVQTATELCGIAQLVRKDVLQIQRSFRLLDKVLMLSGSILQTEQFYKERIAYLLHNLVNETEIHLEELLGLIVDANELCRSLGKTTVHLNKEVRSKTLRQDIGVLRQSIRSLEQQVLTPERWEESADKRTKDDAQKSLFGLASALWTNVSDSVGKSGDFVSEESLDALVENIQERQDEIKSHMSKQQRDSNEQQILQVEKYYVRKMTEQLVSQLKSHQHNLQKKHYHSRGWIKNFVHQKDRKKSLEIQLIDCEARREALRARYQQEYRVIWSQIKSQPDNPGAVT